MIKLSERKMHCKVLAIESTKNTGYKNAWSVLHSFLKNGFVAFNSFGSYPRHSGIPACPLWRWSCFSIKNGCTFKSKCKTEYWHYVNYHIIISVRCKTKFWVWTSLKFCLFIVRILTLVGIGVLWYLIDYNIDDWANTIRLREWRVKNDQNDWMRKLYVLCT